MVHTPKKWWLHKDEDICDPPLYHETILCNAQKLLDYDEIKDCPLRIRKLIPVSDLNIDQITKNVLDKNGIRTIGKILATPSDKIRSMDNIGEKRAEQIKNELAKLNLLELWDYE